MKISRIKYNIKTYTDLIEFHSNTILNIQSNGIFNFISFCYGGIIAKLIIENCLKKNNNFKYNLNTIDYPFNNKIYNFKNPQLEILINIKKSNTFNGIELNNTLSEKHFIKNIPQKKWEKNIE